MISGQLRRRQSIFQLPNQRLDICRDLSELLSTVALNKDSHSLGAGDQSLSLQLDQLRIDIKEVERFVSKPRMQTLLFPQKELHDKNAFDVSLQIKFRRQKITQDVTKDKDDER